MRTLPIAIDETALAAFCRRHGVVEFSLFGSILRDDFRPDSDVDILVKMAPGDEIKTLEKYLDMIDELSALFDGRRIDLVEPRNLANPFRRHEILRTREAPLCSMTIATPPGSLTSCRPPNAFHSRP